MRRYFEENCKLWGLDLAIEEQNSNRDRLFSIYKKTALILSSGISIGDILLGMKIHRVKIYGYGELGKMLIQNLRDKVEICAIYDAEAEARSKESGYMIEPLNNISNDGIPLIITPGKYFRQISWELIQKGIKRESLIALHTILIYGMEILKHGENYSIPDNKEKQFLITGAQFHNNGAQAMLFTAVSEIRNRFPNATVWYLPIDDKSYYSYQIQQNYKMIFLVDGTDLRSQLYEILPGLTAIIDVSGYALSSKWNWKWYMDILRMAYNYQIPLYLMPQSFGPLDFDQETDNELKKLLCHATKIYTREKAGYNLLFKKYHLTNLEMSIDLVLQNKKLNFSGIYAGGQKVKCNWLSTKNNVGIIPNVRNYEFGNKEAMLHLYWHLINKLLELGKNVYIVAHSNDEIACNDIYAMFYFDSNVHLCTDHMNCIEYCEYTKNFQFLIASRFHAIVHAYKENIPCIIIGWAEKYKELASLFEQEKNVYDVRENIDVEHFLKSVEDMNLHYEKEKMKLKKILPDLQDTNCFDFLDNI